MASSLEEMSKNVGQMQRRVLRHILHENATCEYLQTLGLGAPTELASMDDNTLELRFKRCVPVVSYAQMQPYMLRILQGDQSPILMRAPIRAMSLSSGTSEGRGKHFPYFEGLKTGTLQVAQIASAYINQVYPLSSGAKVVEFLFASKLSTTESGLHLAFATAHLIHDNTFKMRQQIRGLTPCCPDEVVFASTFDQGMYCHLLCGLIYRDEVEVLTAVFAYTIVEALRMLQAEWKNLCHDIRIGHLNKNKVIDPALRAAMEDKVLTHSANARLASQVAAICEERSQKCAWDGVVKQLWPRCKYVLSIMTGSMETYVETLREYAGEGIPLVCADYGASEGWIAANINPRSPPHQVSFTTIPSLGYFEFLPLSNVHQHANGAPSSSSSLGYPVQHASNDSAMPINLHEVKLGQDYQILLTTTGGLYRYALGDILRVTGFFYDNPQFAYVCRENAILSINFDQMTEVDLKLAVQKATSMLHQQSSTMKVVDYTSYANTDNAQEHYVIFWEVQNGEIDCLENKRLLAECATLMDETIVENGYVLSRKLGTIKALELCIVKQGTFRTVMECFLIDRNGASITQYKTPRCISKHFPNILSILQENTVAKHFSSAIF